MSSRTGHRVADGPDFICIGAPKSGTGWLFEQLSHHDDFWMPPVKELHGLDLYKPDPHAAPTYRAAMKNLTKLNRYRNRRGFRPLVQTDLDFLATYVRLSQDVSLDDYAALFRWKGRLLSGDITPAYSICKESRIAGVAKRFPHTKVIFFARDPVERFWSQYCMYLRSKKQVFTADLDRVEDILQRSWAKRRSFPSQTVKRWRKYIGRDRFRIFFFDDLRTDSAGLRNDILSFLGADASKPSGPLPADRNRKSGKTRPMPPEVDRFLSAHFADELVRCGYKFGGPAALWAGKHGVEAGRRSWPSALRDWIRR